MFDTKIPFITLGAALGVFSFAQPAQAVCTSSTASCPAAGSASNHELTLRNELGWVVPGGAATVKLGYAHIECFGLWCFPSVVGCFSNNGGITTSIAYVWDEQTGGALGSGLRDDSFLCMGWGNDDVEILATDYVCDGVVIHPFPYQGHELSLYGGTGNDRLRGGTGDEMICGGQGNDTIYGGYGADELDGWSGNDVMWGEAGADSMFGYSGCDRMIGGGDLDADAIYGEGNSDCLEARGLTHSPPTNSTLDCGSGLDSTYEDPALPNVSSCEHVPYTVSASCASLRYTCDI